MIRALRRFHVRWPVRSSRPTCLRAVYPCRSSKDIQDAFAKAEHALAKHHYLRATEAWTKKSIKDAGHELHAAAVSLEHGFAWAGEKLEAGVIKVMDDSRHLAGKLIEGADWAKDEIGEAIESLGREIEKLGKTVTAL